MRRYYVVCAKLWRRVGDEQTALLAWTTERGAVPPLQRSVQAFDIAIASDQRDDPRAAVDVELLQHLADMGLDRRFADAEFVRDQLVREAREDQAQNLALLRGEPSEAPRE